MLSEGWWERHDALIASVGGGEIPPAQTSATTAQPSSKKRRTSGQSTSPSPPVHLPLPLPSFIQTTQAPSVKQQPQQADVGGNVAEEPAEKRPDTLSPQATKRARPKGDGSSSSSSSSGGKANKKKATTTTTTFATIPSTPPLPTPPRRHRNSINGDDPIHRHRHRRLQQALANERQCPRHLTSRCKTRNSSKLKKDCSTVFFF